MLIRAHVTVTRLSTKRQCRPPPAAPRSTSVRARSFEQSTVAAVLLMIDNYDSFTYNLVQYLGELGEEVVVRRNDEITLDEVAAMKPARIVVSPGPCTPERSRHFGAADRALCGRDPDAGRVPGAPEHRPGVRRAHRARASSSCTARPRRSATTGTGVFHGRCPIRFRPRAIIRSSSSARRCPDCLEVTAWTDDGEIMGVRHKTLPVEGVQFHPESILTEHGHDLLRNFLEGENR